MKKIALLLCLLLVSCTASPQILATPTAGFMQTFLPAASTGLNFERSRSAETITTSGNRWILKAGGYSATTHYARIRYRFPENRGYAPTAFYMRTVVILPADFYTKLVSGFRLMNTDSYGTTVNGVHYGATTSGELRTGVFFYSDKTIRVRSQHEGGTSVEYYRGTLPVGEHIIELSGDVAKVAPWYLRIDGIVVTSGTARLSPDSVPVSERVITRLTTGIDGAAGFNSSSITVHIKEFTIADYDPGVIPFTATPTMTPVPPTAVPPTQTKTALPVTATPLLNGTPFPCPCIIQIP